jgi:hypothetical protein
MKYTVFTGCSFTEGVGLPDTKLNKSLWVNRLYNSSESLAKTKLLNLGQGASSNSEIFARSLSAMTEHDCEYLFVCWTTLLRYRFSLGVETYVTEQYWSPHSGIVDVNVNPNITYSKKYLLDVRNKFLALHHDHYEIVKVLNYTRIINQLAQRLRIKAVFVNNILPWDNNYFEYVNKIDRVPADTTEYTQDLLNLKTRSDEEYFVLYDKIHHEYQSIAGLDKCVWLNLHNSFRKNFYLDLGDDNIHPGVASHEAYGDFLAESFEKI